MSAVIIIKRSPTCRQPHNERRNMGHGIELLQALHACEAAQREGLPTDEAVAIAAQAHQVDQIALLDLLLAKQYACAEAQAWLAGAHAGHE